MPALLSLAKLCTAALYRFLFRRARAICSSEAMLFERIASTSARVAETSRRTEKIALLAACIAEIPGEEIDAGVRFLAGQTRQKRLGVGWASIRDTFDAPAALEPSLTIADIDRALSEIAESAGKGSAKKKSEVLANLIGRATAREQSFLRRLLAGEIRQGALESIALEGIARATGVSTASVRRAQMVAADLGSVARAARLEGEAGLQRFKLSLFSPVQPMLAETAKDVDEALLRFQPAAFELKLDGARVQVHKSGSDVHIYTRRLNQATERIPELVEAVRALPAKELILDGEAIALARDGAPLPFQVTMRRFGRKLEVDKMQKELPLQSFFFDILHLDGETLIGRPASERIAALESALPEALRIPRIVTADPVEAKAFLDAALERGHEGAMAKSLDALYEAGNRGASWLKLKTAHTLDLVVLGVEWGSGRREGWLSNLHLGARDEATGGFVMLGKTFKGMTDEMLEWQTKRLLELETHREGHIVWVKPELVVEIAIGDVQESPVYPAGLALRFARVKRYRTDKRPDDADTLARVALLRSR
jgi:DNA ligase-1